MTSSLIIIESRPLKISDQLMPFLISSVIDADGNIDLSLLKDQNRLLFIIENIMKYVSTIQSSEYFIDEIIHHQNEISDKIKILKFLNNCFQITDTLIQYQIDHTSKMSNSTQKSLFSSSFSLEELYQADYKIKNLLDVIEQRMEELQTWIPPTMPFINF